jgi:hypothetical protein
LPWEELDELVILQKREDPAKEFIRELRDRNFPPAGRQQKNTILLVSGNLRDGKSTTAAKLIIGAGDGTYVPSMRYHPANGGHSADLWKCHLSTAPGPLIEAVSHELKRVKAGLPQEYLVPGSWWHLDEPTEIKSTEWWTQAAKDVGDTVIENAFLDFNVIICTPVKGRVLTMLRELANGWIRQYRVGYAMLHKFKSELNYKSASRPEIRKPIGAAPIVDDVDPKDPRADRRIREWHELYMPIKIWNAEGHAADRLIRTRETRRKVARKAFDSAEGMKRNIYVT